jgi:hypothetical protein
LQHWLESHDRVDFRKDTLKGEADEILEDTFSIADSIDEIDDDSIYSSVKQIIAFLRQSRAPVNRSIIEKTFHRTLSNDSLLQHWLESHDRVNFRLINSC